MKRDRNSVVVLALAACCLGALTGLSTSERTTELLSPKTEVDKASSGKQETHRISEKELEQAKEHAVKDGDLFSYVGPELPHKTATESRKELDDFYDSLPGGTSFGRQMAAHGKHSPARTVATTRGLARYNDAQAQTDLNAYYDSLIARRVAVGHDRIEEEKAPTVEVQHVISAKAISEGHTSSTAKQADQATSMAKQPDHAVTVASKWGPLRADTLQRSNLKSHAVRQEQLRKTLAYGAKAHYGQKKGLVGSYPVKRKGMPAPYTQKATPRNGGVGDQIHNSAREVHDAKAHYDHKKGLVGSYLVQRKGMPAPYTQKAPLDNNGVGDQIHNSARKVQKHKIGKTSLVASYHVDPRHSDGKKIQQPHGIGNEAAPHAARKAHTNKLVVGAKRHKQTHMPASAPVSDASIANHLTTVVHTLKKLGDEERKSVVQAANLVESKASQVYSREKAAIGKAATDARAQMEEEYDFGFKPWVRKHELKAPPAAA